MNSRFNPLLQTLVSINEARQAAGGETVPQRDESHPTAAAGVVPSGRTTLKLSKKGETPTAASVSMTPPTPAVQPPPPTTKLRPQTAAAPADHTAVVPPPPPPEPTITPNNIPEIFEAELEPDYFEPTPVPRSETAAALHVRASTRPKKPKQPPQPEDMVQTAFRLTHYLKETFEKTCRDRGTNPSAVIRMLIRQYCGL